MNPPGCVWHETDGGKILLPGQLRIRSSLPNLYLQPTFIELEKFDPADLGGGDEEATTIVEDAIRQRVHGMDADTASQTIAQDAALIREWCQRPGVPQGAGFIYGVLEGILMFANIEELIN